MVTYFTFLKAEMVADLLPHQFHMVMTQNVVGCQPSLMILHMYQVKGIVC